MTGAELGFCLSAVLSSSISQLFIKAASTRGSILRSVSMLGIGAVLLLCSVLLAIMALRTLQLSQLVSIAAVAYLLVPIRSHWVFNERLRPRFWLGALFIVIGVLCTTS